MLCVGLGVLEGRCAAGPVTHASGRPCSRPARKENGTGSGWGDCPPSWPSEAGDCPRSPRCLSPFSAVKEFAGDCLRQTPAHQTIAVWLLGPRHQANPPSEDPTHPAVSVKRLHPPPSASTKVTADSASALGEPDLQDSQSRQHTGSAAIPPCVPARLPRSAMENNMLPPTAGLRTVSLGVKT